MPIVNELDLHDFCLPKTLILLWLRRIAASSLVGKIFLSGHDVTNGPVTSYRLIQFIIFSPSPTPLIGAKGGFDGPLPTKPPLFLSGGPDLGVHRVILGNMRPKSQLVLKDSAITKPSGLREFLGELRKSESVSGYHYIPAREPK